MRSQYRRAASLAVLGLLAWATTASAAANWKNKAWQDDLGTFRVDPAYDHLIVTAFDEIQENRWGSAWYTASAEFQAQPEQVVTVSFHDSGFPGGAPGPGPQLWIYEPDDPATGEWGSAFSIGAWQRAGAATYQIGFADYDPPFDSGYIDTGVPRSAGLHRLRARLRPDDVLEFYLDDVLVWTHTAFPVRALRDIYLAVHGDQLPGTVEATFTDFYLNDAPPPPPPLPGPLEVDIDVKPFCYPNVLNLRSHASVPVAIWSTPSYNASDIDPRSVRLAGARPRLKCLWDLDRDGDRDLILIFCLPEMDVEPGDTEVELTGALKDGTAIVGTDTVVVLPRRGKR